MEKTDKSAEEILDKIDRDDYGNYYYSQIIVAMHEYAAQQLSEYNEYFELAERAKQVLRDKGYGWTGLDILETCKLVPNNDSNETM